jgi:hypothetical protein
LRHDGSLGGVGAFENRRHLSRFAGLQHERRLAAIAVAPFDEIGRHGGRVVNSVRGADDADKRTDRGWARRLMFRRGLHRDQR